MRKRTGSPSFAPTGMKARAASGRRQDGENPETVEITDSFRGDVVEPRVETRNDRREITEQEERFEMERERERARQQRDRAEIERAAQAARVLATGEVEALIKMLAAEVAEIITEHSGEIDELQNENRALRLEVAQLKAMVAETAADHSKATLDHLPRLQ